MALVWSTLKWAVTLILLGYTLNTAFRIRMHAIDTFGTVIHEFDPWFNYRATEYLAANGKERFFKWFDYMTWYPLGRPIGTTIYPGMQFTAVYIWEFLKGVPKTTFTPGFPVTTIAPYLPKKFSIGPMTLNDVCCYIPVWFGGVATFAMFLLTIEASGSKSAGVAAAYIMSRIPAHTMRSVGGGFDNESIAVSAICFTFYFWIKSLQSDGVQSIVFGILSGLAYFYMVAAWGGYIFVVNMVGLHAAFMTLTNYSDKLFISYSLFYVIGVSLGMQVPVVGWTPLKSLEQIMPLAVFLGLVVIFVSDKLRGPLPAQAGFRDIWGPRIRNLTIIFGGLIAVSLFVLGPMGYFGPLSSRIRGLFLKHQRTGNPLVDSVAEHQPATPEAYQQYLHNALMLCPIGFLALFVNRNPAKYFLILYAIVAQQFSLKMVRLLIICGPLVSAVAGIGFGVLFDQCAKPFGEYLFPAKADAEPSQDKDKKNKKKAKLDYPSFVPQDIAEYIDRSYDFYSSPATLMQRMAIAGAVLAFSLVILPQRAIQFTEHSEQFAQGMSNPQIMFKARVRQGERESIIDDYYQAYIWLKENTPEDSRVLAWWDYGYQITGVANRTTIADGNTWNHEHLGTLARCLVSSEKRAHKIIKHIADYVLVWAGGGGDDLAKSIHMARIGTSVYTDICPNDPICSQFGFGQHGEPSPMMAKSVVFRLVRHGQGPVKANPKYFEEVHTSKYGLIRIFKVNGVSEESKKWNADPANRICDAPGSWYCNGQYPPALSGLMKKRKDFAQLENFNQKEGEESEYSKYVRRHG